MNDLDKPVLTPAAAPTAEWMNDPRIASIPKYKLDFLQKMFFESKKLSKKESKDTPLISKFSKIFESEFFKARKTEIEPSINVVNF